MRTFNFCYFRLRRISFGEPPVKLFAYGGPPLKCLPAAHLLRRAAAQNFRLRRSKATGCCRFSTGGVRRIRRPGGNTGLRATCTCLTLHVIMNYGEVEDVEQFNTISSRNCVTLANSKRNEVGYSKYNQAKSTRNQYYTIVASVHYNRVAISDRCASSFSDIWAFRVYYERP
jgi:hypothetical protein